MYRNWVTALAAFAALFATTGAALAEAEPPRAPTLRIGDTAPTIETIAWIKGRAVTKYEPGRVYVVEFWATWCPPCMKTIPHLTALQKKYADTLTVIGIDVDGSHGKGLDEVRAFVKVRGTDMMYTVGMEDPVRMPMTAAWITAEGASGVPTASIVDRRGKLVWVGYPDVVQSYPFDEALEDALAGKIDLSRSRVLQDSNSQATAAYFGQMPTKG